MKSEKIFAKLLKLSRFVLYHNNFYVSWVTLANSLIRWVNGGLLTRFYKPHCRFENNSRIFGSEFFSKVFFCTPKASCTEISSLYLIIYVKFGPRFILFYLLTNTFLFHTCIFQFRLLILNRWTYDLQWILCVFQILLFFFEFILHLLNSLREVTGEWTLFHFWIN